MLKYIHLTAILLMTDCDLTDMILSVYSHDYDSVDD